MEKKHLTETIFTLILPLFLNVLISLSWKLVWFDFSHFNFISIFLSMNAVVILNLFVIYFSLNRFTKYIKINMLVKLGLLYAAIFAVSLLAAHGWKTHQRNSVIAEMSHSPRTEPAPPLVKLKQKLCESWWGQLHCGWQEDTLWPSGKIIRYGVINKSYNLSDQELEISSKSITKILESNCDSVFGKGDIPIMELQQAGQLKVIDISDGAGSCFDQKAELEILTKFLER